METQTLQRTKTLQEAIVSSRLSWKIGRVFGRSSYTGEPFDIMVEPVIGNIRRVGVDHLSGNSTGIFLCANEKSAIMTLRSEFAQVGSGFRFESDPHRHFWVKPETADAVRQIEELISTLTRDSQ